MKKLLLLIFVCCMFAGQSFAQKAQVLYFKANLGCCQARACNNLENQIKQVVESNYENGEVVFKSIRINSEENSDLVKQFNAKSQTVVIVNSEKDSSFDATEMVRNYRRTRNQTEFEEQLTEAIKEIL